MRKYVNCYLGEQTFNHSHNESLTSFFKHILNNHKSQNFTRTIWEDVSHLLPYVDNNWTQCP